MKRFISILLLFSMPFIISGLLFELLLRNIPNDYSYKKSYLDENSNKIEKLFLGSSHAYYGINPSFIQGNSFNASHISQSINWDYEIIKKYENEWRNLKYLVIPIDYFTLFARTETGQEAWRVKNYNIYYNLFTSTNISEYSESLSFDIETNFERIKTFYFLNKSNITCSTLGFGTSDILNKDLVDTGKTAAKRHTKSSFSYYDGNLDILKEILIFSERNNIKILFYTTPAFNTYVSNLNKKQLDLTIKAVTKLSISHNNCTYVNLLEDNYFKFDDFRDADHLNPRGAKKLTLKLDSIINFSFEHKSFKH